MAQADDNVSAGAVGEEIIGGQRERPIPSRARAPNGQRNSSAVIAAKERLVKHFLGMIILYKLKQDITHGYDLIKFVHKTFGIFLSPGTVYPVLYELEKNGIVRSEMMGKRRMYSLADRSTAEAFFGEFIDAHLCVLEAIGADFNK